MKRRILRPLTVGLATLTTVATLAVTAVSSQAAQTGTLSFSPATGNGTTLVTVVTSAPCASGTNVQVSVTGQGFNHVNMLGNSPITFATDPVTGGYDVPLADTFSDFAGNQSPVPQLSGEYDFDLFCRANSGVGTHLGDFTGAVVFTAAATNDASTYAAIVPATNYTTTTSLASSPSSPVDTGVPVAFTAIVASTPAGGAAGTVQLLDGTTPIGSPTAVDASGMAVITTSFATTGSHSITAAFTGATANVGNSVSTASVYTVNQSPATSTTTGLAISPAAADSNTPVTLTATVAPGAAAGKVQFSDGSATIGSPVTVAGGTAALTQTFAAGAHSFTAAFTPTNPVAYAGSVSTSQTLNVTAGASNVTSETLETTVAAGSLTISVADSSKVILPSPALNAAGTYLTTAGAIHQVTVSDTRAGNPGWNVSGQASDFFGPGGASIVGSNLGWTPKVTTVSNGQTVTAGAAVLPTTAPVLTNPAADPGTGLHFGRTLASAAAGHGTGFALLDATLALTVPTTVVAGTYDATLTLTAI